MKTVPKAPKDSKTPKLAGSEDIGIGDFIDQITRQRRRRMIDEDFAEDSVLKILNHRKRWRQTLSNKARRLLKVKHMDDEDLRLN
jgi:hypothetical protein